MTDTTTTKTRTITLTGRPPVTIREDQWPDLAYASYEHGVDRHTNQWDRRREAFVRVRQHADGRAIVYARYDYTTRWQGEHDETRRAGVLLPIGATTEQIIAAIHQVWASLDVDPGGDERIVQECIADLPAVAL